MPMLMSTSMMEQTRLDDGIGKRRCDAVLVEGNRTGLFDWQQNGLSGVSSHQAARAPLFSLTTKLRPGWTSRGNTAARKDVVYEG
jgi:hypothetical protein